jgi:type VI secretion system protein ImpA
MPLVFSPVPKIEVADRPKEQRVRVSDRPVVCYSAVERYIQRANVPLRRECVPTLVGGAVEPGCLVMSEGWNGQALLEPISIELPCGESLEDKPPLIVLDALRLFGQPRSPDTPPDPDETRKPPDWAEVRGGALDGLAKSKDLRLLAYLAAATLRTDGLPNFFDTLTVASRWLDSYWGQVYPLIDEDAIARRNALNCLADPMAVIERLRRVALVDSQKHGKLSLRDIEMATGQIPGGASDTTAEQARIVAVFADLPNGQLAELQQRLVDAMAALDSITEKMRAEGGSEVVPSFEPLSVQLLKINRLFAAHLIPPAAATAAVGPGAAPGEASPPARSAVAGIASRQDAIRALDAVAEFFRRNEPSSPIPMFLERAKRLVAKDFLEVLADIAPEALAGARAAGGIRENE